MDRSNRLVGPANFLQVVCILRRFFIWVLTPAGVAAKGICDNDRFLIFQKKKPPFAIILPYQFQIQASILKN